MAGESKPELFNLVDDLGEKNNLAAEQPDRVEAMIEAHKAWLKEMRKGVEKVSG
ncbi:MAG: hypothetical protein AAF085_01570 [Planctomycetota bacterium]